MAGAPQVAQLTPQPPYVLALDVGSSSVRALLYDANGDVIPEAKAQRTYDSTTAEDGEVSIDPNMLVAAVTSVIDDVLRQAGPLVEQIAAVATDTFWHSLIVLDASGRPLTPVLTWADTRADAAARELGHELDVTAIHERTGATLHTSYWPAKLRWLTQSCPDVMARAAQLVSFGEYLHRQYLGRSVCSLSMASATGLFITRQQTWDTSLLDHLGLRPEILPSLGDIHDALRGLVPANAERWQVLRDVPWFPALGDGAVANVGSGCTVPERLALTVGTTSAMRAVVPAKTVTPPPGLWLYLLDAKRALLGGALSEGGNFLAWLEKTLRLPPLTEAEPVVAALQPDAHGLTILPFLTGERSPGWHGDAHATIAGIRSNTSPVELLRAGVESLAYRISTVHERLAQALLADNAVHASPIVIGSGGTLLSSPLFRQILADTLGKLLYPLREREASARGAALIALEALGILSDVAQVAPDLDPPIEPGAASGAVYHKAAERQLQLYQLLLGASAV
ncbi:MAG: gluconokinase [Ktedonobacterales bacterium]